MPREILYVDDEPANLLVFEAAFEDHFHVHCATSAAEALETLDQFAIPLVIADHRMPNVTGVELLTQIRKRDPHIQRIILSGYSDSEALIDAINLGQIFHFVRKPWNRTELHAVINRALEMHDLGVQNSHLTEQMLVSERCALLGQCAGQITHEMGNQLNILPLVELIEAEYVNDSQLLEFAGMARTTHERLLQLLDEVKLFVRFDTRGIELQPLNLADCLRELISFLRFNPAIPYQWITFRLEAEPTVLVNKIKLHQVLINLLKNAVDALGDRANPCILISLKQEGSTAVVQVTDNGGGIAPETVDRIWDLYFSTKGDQGNGIGLDFARQLIEAHNGQISCHSVLGGGTTFTIRLPLIEAVARSA